MAKWTDIVRTAKREAPKRFPRLREEFRKKLKLITPTQSIYFPVLVTLRGGDRRDAVYLSPAIPWFEMWGGWPEEDAGKNALPLEEILDFEESPSRLPLKFAEALYAAGESGMGYHAFQAHFSDGTTASFLTGNAIDFPHLPLGKTPEDIVAVTPHAGREEPVHRDTLDYAWCLFS